MLAKAVAAQCKTAFFNISASALSSKFRGDSELMMRILFDIARYYAPSTIFFDEIDSIAGSRGGAGEHEASNRVKTELMVQMDGVGSEGGEGEGETPRIIVIAATNIPNVIDEAILRRLEKRIYIPLPDAKTREELFRINMKGVDFEADVDFVDLAQRASGYSGCDVANVCRDASMMSVRTMMQSLSLNLGQATPEVVQEHINEKKDLQRAVSRQDFLTALSKVKKSVSDEDLERFSNWAQEFGAM